MTRGGVVPSAVIGHSSGEIAAAYATGALSVDEAMIVAYYRGFISQQQPQPQQATGGMAAIGLGSEAVSPFLQEGVVLACENSPSSTTISGDIDVLEQVVGTIKAQKPDVMVRQLKVDMAYHSRKSGLGFCSEHYLTRHINRSHAAPCEDICDTRPAGARSARHRS